MTLELPKEVREALELEARRCGISVQGLLEWIALSRVRDDLQRALDEVEAEMAAHPMRAPAVGNVVRLRAIG